MISKYQNIRCAKRSRKAVALLVTLICLCFFCSCKKEQTAVDETRQIQQTESNITLPEEMVSTKFDDEETLSETGYVVPETNPTEDAVNFDSIETDYSTEVPVVTEETQTEYTVAPGGNETDLQ